MKKIYKYATARGARVLKQIRRDDWLALFRSGKATIHAGRPAVCADVQKDRETYYYVSIKE